MDIAHGARMVPVPPPLYYAAGFALGMRLNRVVPMPVGARPLSSAAGVLAIGSGVGLSACGAREIILHRTTLIPIARVSTLVTTGPYRFSRNPMYAGLALAYSGVSLLAGSWWPLVTLPGVLYTVRRMVIEPEERHLADRFGEAYADYRSRVRRWL